MKVRLARTAGFCMGVRRAMEIVLAEANKKNDRLVTFGPLIHNEQVLHLLESKGIESVGELDGLRAGRIVIRAHGIPPQERRAIKELGLKIIDATCPRVARVQAIIRYYTNKGYSAVIVGDTDHPEVIGLVGYSKRPAHVIQGAEDVERLPRLNQPFAVAQTTQSEQNFRAVVRRLKERFPDVLVFDTICEATHQRQEEITSLANQVDAVVVVGGYHSGNTCRLAQASRSMGLPTFHVETEKDLKKEELARSQVVGVTAGASTPNWMIKNVIKEIEGIQSGKERYLGHWARRVTKFLILSNLFSATGAFFFAYAGSILSGRHPELLHPLITFLYIYAMHVLNRFLDKGASAYNDPERASFHRRHRSLLISMGVAATLGALVVSSIIGISTFVAMSVLSLGGIIYSIHLLPGNLRHLLPYSKLKDIPGSKTFSEAIAWAAVIIGVPLLSTSEINRTATIISIYTVLSMGYTRSALFDIFQIQGDLIVGTETLPIVLGEKKTLSILKGVLFSCGASLAFAPLLGLVSYFSLLTLPSIITLFLCLIAYERRWLYPGVSLEALVEASFFLAGFLAFVWQIFSWQA